MLMQYLEYARERLQPSQPLESLLRFLFNLHFTLPDRFYKLNVAPHAKMVFETILNDFEELGLVYRSKSRSKIAASQLLKLWQTEPTTSTTSAATRSGG